jgi:hypothetical protein
MSRDVLATTWNRSDVGRPSGVDRSNAPTPIGHQPDGTSVAEGQPPEGKEAPMARIFDTTVSTLLPVVGEGSR